MHYINQLPKLIPFNDQYNSFTLYNISFEIIGNQFENPELLNNKNTNNEVH